MKELSLSLPDDVYAAFVPVVIEAIRDLRARRIKRASRRYAERYGA